MKQLFSTNVMRSMLAAAALGAWVGTAFLAGCEEEGPLERAGEKADKATEEVGEELEKAGEEIQDATKNP